MFKLRILQNTAYILTRHKKQILWCFFFFFFKWPEAYHTFQSRPTLTVSLSISLCLIHYCFGIRRIHVHMAENRRLVIIHNWKQWKDSIEVRTQFHYFHEYMTIFTLGKYSQYINYETIPMLKKCMAMSATPTWKNPFFLLRPIKNKIISVWRNCDRMYLSLIDRITLQCQRQRRRDKQLGFDFEEMIIKIYSLAF